MSKKLPFYMVYENQLPVDWMKEMENQRDLSYMKSMYPEAAKKILPFVEAECDRFEYDVSMIYDEYPDRLQIQLLCQRVYRKVTEETSELLKEEAREGWLKELVWVMVCQEICHRRQEKRNARKTFYFG